MTKEYALITVAEDCIGCHACEVACKQEHNLPVGPRWIRVFSDGPKQDGDRLQLGYVVAYCMHCSRPPCKDSCPVDAITKREDGVVLINEELCIGCKDCIEACPLGVMQFDSEREVAQKCDLCVGRLDCGLQPACVTVCPSHCLYHGDIYQVLEILGKKRSLDSGVWAMKGQY